MPAYSIPYPCLGRRRPAHRGPRRALEDYTSTLRVLLGATNHQPQAKDVP